MRHQTWIALLVLLCAAPADSRAVDDGLVGHWRFDTAAGSVADLSGHGHAAQVSNVKTLVENGRTVLALDGRQKILIPSSPEFNLRRGFSVVAKVKLVGDLNRLIVIAKEEQYMLRVDQAEEGGRFSFFPYLDGHWEPRVGSLAPTIGAWYHLAATWDGSHVVLWVNGLPFSRSRGGNLPAANDAPLMILSSLPQGGMRGAVDYVKIYRRALSPREVALEAFGIDDARAGVAATSFDFAAGQAIDGWTTQEGATAAIVDRRLVVGSTTPNSLVIHKGLGVNVDKKDFVSLRMAVDRGARATLIFVTTKGTGQMPFQTRDDRKPHTYVLDPWTLPGWGGNLLALALIPSDVVGNAARIEYVHVGEEPRAAPDVQVDRIFTDATLARAKRPERIRVRLHNMAGAAETLTATLSAPDGVSLKSPAAQAVPAIKHDAETEITWDVEASHAVTGPFCVTVSGPGMAEPTRRAETLAFHADLPQPKAAYVPVPVPAKTKYTLWTHYCALWKQGTHYGWKKIEPWPERKPLLGWYNEGTPEVADWHIKYMVEHGISGVIYCWYRSSVNEPVKQSLGHALEDGLLKARYLSMIKFGIMWENGCAQGVASADDLMRNVLPFWIEHYFSHPSYIRVQGRPVLYVWVPSRLRTQLGGSENVRKALDQMRAECKRRGLGGLYLVACSQSQNREAIETLAKEGWDATSAYGNSWRPPAELTTVGSHTCAPVDGFIDQQEALWKFKRNLHLLPDITVAMMGWDPRPWHETGFFWSENTPQKFRELCRRAKAVIDASATSGPEKNTTLFCCWNEFGEGHYIEPTRGHGFAYLDAIRDVFCEPSPAHCDVVPEDVGLAPADSWYRATREAIQSWGQTPSWSNEGLALWTGMMGLDGVELRQGVLRGTSKTSDPAFLSPTFVLRANRYAKAVVEMRLSRPAGSAQLFWSTKTAGANGAASVVLPTVADGQWHSYTFDVGKNPEWGGCITSLRFDPGSEEGVVFEIRSIRLE
jgi:hypothetical protein